RLAWSLACPYLMSRLGFNHDRVRDHEVLWYLDELYHWYDVSAFRFRPFARYVWYLIFSLNHLCSCEPLAYHPYHPVFSHKNVNGMALQQEHSGSLGKVKVQFLWFHPV